MCIRDRLGAGVFQPEDEQQQQHADLRRQVDEILGEVQLDQPARPEDQPGGQVGGDRADADAIRQPCEEPQADEEDTQLDERSGDVGSCRRKKDLVH